MIQPLLSIGMIVKNEERCLEKCLKALEPLRQALPCELVIADTGSTDRTLEIAEKYADILFHFAWVNDFSKARNAVMDKCSGKWYLTVDADEYLASPIDEIVEFLTGPLAQKNIHASIIQRNFKSPNMSGEYSDFNALRMVRMDTGKRYEGSIHETFPYIEIPLTHILRETIFNHDGYTALNKKHLKQKSKRNLELLESELKEEPENIRRVLQCFESCGDNVSKRKYFANYSKKLLQSLPANAPYMSISGAPCAKETLRVLIFDNQPDAKDFFKWALKTFPNSYHIHLDARYFFIKYYYEKGDWEECQLFCEEFLKYFDKYHNRDITPTIADFGSPVASIQPHHKIEIQTLLSNTLINLGKEEEAKKHLSTIDLSLANKTGITNWFAAILNAEHQNIFTQLTSEVIGNFLQKHYSGNLKNNDIYNIIIATISKPFTCSENRKHNYSVFEAVPGTIGLSAKIANAKTKEEVEDYLNKIDVWEDFMPLALGKVIELNAKLPDEFFIMNSVRLAYLINDLIRNINKYSQKLIENYFNIDCLFSFPRVVFSHNLLLSVFFGKNFNKLSYWEKENFLSAFYNIAKKYLNTCYNELILSNEELIICLPTTTLFSWYLVKANSLKDSNPLEYIKTLRTALKKVPQAKDVIEFLIEEFKNEEELKRQEKIKNTSPELLQMAEQLKTMLAALPPNSPELLAIKQSPMYKQVAFLIED